MGNPIDQISFKPLSVLILRGCNTGGRWCRLTALWKKDNENFNRSEYVALSNALTGYYERNSAFACFDSFYEFLKNDFVHVLEGDKVKDKDFDVSNFLYVLRPYYKGGEFDYLLNANENLDLLQQRFIVFELDNIKDHPSSSL